MIHAVASFTGTVAELNQSLQPLTSNRNLTMWDLQSLRELNARAVKRAHDEEDEDEDED